MPTTDRRQERRPQRVIGYVLIWELPGRVQALLNDYDHMRWLLEGYLCGLEESEAHLELARRLRREGCTVEDTASAIYHADRKHRLNRALMFALHVEAELCDAA